MAGEFLKLRSIGREKERRGEEGRRRGEEEKRRRGEEGREKERKGKGEKEREKGSMNTFNYDKHVGREKGDTLSLSSTTFKKNI